MKKCNQMLLAAVMGMSLTAGAFAQSSGSSSAGSSAGTAAGFSASGNQNQTGGSAPAAGGTGLTTPSDADRATNGSAAGSTAGDASSTAGDAAGNVANSADRSMQRGQMGGDADAMISAQMDKLASMPDKAADGLFVLDNAKGNMFEVEFAKLAQQKSQDDKIKDLAKTIEKDHTAANEQLKTIATKMGLELPTSLPSDKQKMLQVLSAMSPTDFDTCYLLDNKMDHAKDITSFADHAKSVKDEDLRKYITAVLPKLQQHGMHVQQLASEKGYQAPLGGGHGMGGMGMDHGGMNHGDAGEGAAGAGGATGNSSSSSNK